MGKVGYTHTAEGLVDCGKGVQVIIIIIINLDPRTKARMHVALT